jgi:hypothetical protein
VQGQIGQQLHKAALFLFLYLGGVVSGPCAVFYHLISIRRCLRITLGIWLIYAEFVVMGAAS